MAFHGSWMAFDGCEMEIAGFSKAFARILDGFWMDIGWLFDDFG